MKLRTAPLFDYAEYILDSAAEQMEICSATSTTLHLYADTDRVMAITGNDRDPNRPMGRGSLRDRWEMCRRLEEYACEIIAELPERRQATIIREGLLSIRHHINELADCVACWFFTDSSIGGCLVDLKESYGRRLTAEMLPPAALARRLQSRKAMKHYAPSTINGTGYELTAAAFNRLLKLPQRLVWDGDLVDEVDALFSDFEELHNAGRARSAAYEQRIMDEIRGMHPAEQLDRVQITIRHKGFRKKIRQAIAAERKVVKRSANIAAAIVGPAVVSAFAKGELVRIHGTSIDFEVQRSRSLGTSGHGAVRVGLRIPRTGERLAGLCVYWDDIPALDQLAAVALYAQSGLESELIAGGNLYSINAEASDITMIEGRMQAHVEEREIRVVRRREERRRGHHRQFDQEVFDGNCRAYMKWAKPRFAEILGIWICGRRYPAMQALSMRAAGHTVIEPLRLAA